MLDIAVVIGANYGDEGKGVITDALAFRRPDALVVMTNGGAQRGHTVIDPTTKRPHVFHHFGSATFRGCATYFPDTFILNPMQFAKEYRELSDGFGLGCIRTIRHNDCLFSTPFDMILNQDIEKWRKKQGEPYGTCGMGVWETIVRCRRGTAFELSAFYQTLDHFLKARPESQWKWLKYIRDEYCPRRYKAITGEKWHPDSFVMSEGLIAHFIQDAEFMGSKCSCEHSPFSTLADHEGAIIFENGQGLLLDDEYAGSELSKFSTPSRTGLRNVKNIIDRLRIYRVEINSVDAYYVSRPYLTRHGPGKVLNSKPEPLGSSFFADGTNGCNDFQGDFRQFKIDEEAQAALILRDTKEYLSPIKAEKKSVTLSYTHLDQMVPEKRLFKDIVECGVATGAEDAVGFKW